MIFFQKKTQPKRVVLFYFIILCAPAKRFNKTANPLRKQRSHYFDLLQPNSCSLTSLLKRFFTSQRKNSGWWRRADLKSRKCCAHAHSRLSKTARRNAPPPPKKKTMAVCFLKYYQHLYCRIFHWELVYCGFSDRMVFNNKASLEKYSTVQSPLTALQSIHSIVVKSPDEYREGRGETFPELIFRAKASWLLALNGRLCECVTEGRRGLRGVGEPIWKVGSRTNTKSYQHLYVR